MNQRIDHTMGKLEGKVAVVTGGSEGIGFASAKRFIAEGAKVVITGRRQEELDKAVVVLGKSATSVRADVSKLAQLDELFTKVKTLHGHIDVLLANAGVAKFAPLGEITEEDFDYHFDINVKGTVFTVQKALPLLAPGSSVILLSSVVGVSGNAGASVYSATKAAIRNLARSWILDLKGRNIRVNVLSPGATRTPGLERLAPPGQAEALVASFASAVPMGRAGEADEMGKVAVFLASDDSSYVNGAEIFVDGGMAQV